MKKDLEVAVFGQKISLKTEADPGFVQEVVQLVDRHMSTVSKRSGRRPDLQLALLACLNLAAEQLQDRQKTSEKLSQVKSRIHSLMDRVDH